jgi:class 3 adenylate cyclase
MTAGEPLRRRLAAILAADIAGYGRLMGQDEAATVRDLKGHQAAILPLVGRHGGQRAWKRCPSRVACSSPTRSTSRSAIGWPSPSRIWASES